MLNSLSLYGTSAVDGADEILPQVAVRKLLQKPLYYIFPKGAIKFTIRPIPNKQFTFVLLYHIRNATFNDK